MEPHDLNRVFEGISPLPFTATPSESKNNTPSSSDWNPAKEHSGSLTSSSVPSGTVKSASAAMLYRSRSTWVTWSVAPLSSAVTSTAMAPGSSSSSTCFPPPK